MSRTIPTLVFVTGLLLAPLTHATLLTYSYVGPDFNDPSPLPAPYVAGDHVEGYITIDDSFLDPSGSGTLFEACFAPAGCEGSFPPDADWLIDWSFTDGVQTFSSDGPVLSDWYIGFVFDSLDITAWFVDLVGPSADPYGLQVNCGNISLPLTCDSVGWGVDYATDTSDGLADVQVLYDSADAPTWGRSVAQVPEPTTLALLSISLVGLGFTRCRMKA